MLCLSKNVCFLVFYDFICVNFRKNWSIIKNFEHDFKVHSTTLRFLNSLRIVYSFIFILFIFTGIRLKVLIYHRVLYVRMS